MAESTRMTWHECTAGDVIVRYAVAGAGPPLVLLHGLSASTRWWRRNIPVLAREFRVYAVDLVRFGGAATEQCFALSEASARIAAWMEAVGIERASVAGHSMGGHIAAELAADFPARVERLVLVSPAVLFPSSGPKLSPLGLLQTGWTFPVSLLPILVQDALGAGPRRLWRSTGDLLARDLRDKLPAIQAPTLLIWGARDGLLPVSLAAEVARLIPRCEQIIVPNAGHSAMWETPRFFNETVRNFLLGEAYAARVRE